MHYLKEMADGSRIQGIYYCKSKVSTVTKNGKPYEDLTLQDKSGTINAKVWEPSSPGIGEYEEGDFIEVNGDVVDFRGMLQARITRIRACADSEYDPADYMPVTSKNIEEMYGRLLELCDSMDEKYYRDLLDHFFRDEKFTECFKKASAAKTVHHAFIGGLLEHTLGVARLCDHLAGAYPCINRDLLVTAALLHDIGKTGEIAPYPQNEYTDEGQLTGHIVMGAMMIHDAVKEMEGFPKETAKELEHCILAHHGELEYGSPKKPAIMEAMVLNLADNTDAKIETMAEALAVNEKTDWVGFNKFLDSNLRHTKSGK